MSRMHGRVLSRIWDDPEFLALDGDAQRTYLFLLSQPDLNYAGLIALRPRRWSSKAAGQSSADVVRALKVLDVARFVLVDEDTEEVLVRTLVRNDGIYKQPKVMIRMGQDARQIASRRLRLAFAREMRRLPFEELKGAQRAEAETVALSLAGEFDPHGETLTDTPADTLPDTPPMGYAEGYPEGFAEPLPEGSPIPSAYARAHSPSPQPPSPNPPLLTFVGRLAESDARVRACPPEQVIDSWQRIAGPDVDLDREWLMYLAKRGMTPPRDPWAAWVGWLQQAARHAAAARGSPPIGCDACLSGWIPDEFGWASERPCPTCKPHIAT